MWALGEKKPLPQIRAGSGPARSPNPLFFRRFREAGAEGPAGVLGWVSISP